MIKKRTISLYGKSKITVFCKCCLALGVVFLVTFIILSILSAFAAQANVLLAFSILLLGIGAILYFFHYQFAKLAKIANEIENETESTDSP